MSSAIPEKLHSELGASVASRWMACPGSVQLIRAVPKQIGSGSSEFAQEGTAAHALAELCLTKGADPSVYLGVKLEGVEVDEDMIDFTRVYIDHCRAKMQIPGSTYWIEKRFNLAKLGPPAPMFGTGDFICLDRQARRLDVDDLKFGQGVVIEIQGNKQLRYYALGALLSLPQDEIQNIDDIKMTIVQPRAAHPDGPIRSEVISVMDLLDFTGELMSAARRTMDPDAPLAVGNHCRFCPAIAYCPEQHKNAQLIAQTEFEVMPETLPPSPASLPMDQLLDIMDKLPILESWMKQVREHVQSKLIAGEDVPGWKMVAKRANRKWQDSEGVAQALLSQGKKPEDIYKQELKSPAQIEKLLGGKKKFESNVVAGSVIKVSSGYSMVSASDPRPAVSLTAGEEFAVLEAGEE